jgi:MscS family membrane protein
MKRIVAAFFAIIGFAPGLSAAAVAPTPGAQVEAAASGALGDFADWLQALVSSIPTVHPNLVRWTACCGLLAGAILLRRVIVNFAFVGLKKLAARHKLRFHEKVLPVLELPGGVLIILIGVFGAFSVLALSPATVRVVLVGTTEAVIVVAFWGLLRAGGAVLGHLEQLAQERSLRIAPLMPLIRRTLATLVILFGGLMVAKGLGIDVGSMLAGLGIGGLAFAFAAQETIANLFGSLVVALDRPFELGEFIRIGANEGYVEEIGLRSTKIRTPAETLVVIPNKTVASEVITNITRMPQRRVDQTVGLTYDTSPPEQLEALLADWRKLLHDDSGVAKDFIAVHLIALGSSSLDIQLIYFTADPDFRRHLEVRERINFALLRSVAAHGMSFAYPTQVMHLDGPVVKQIVEQQRAGDRGAASPPSAGSA